MGVRNNQDNMSYRSLKVTIGNKMEKQQRWAWKADLVSVWWTASPSGDSCPCGLFLGEYKERQEDVGRASGTAVSESRIMGST